MAENRLMLFTPCWGEKHLNLLRTTLGRSLRWNKNYEVVKNAHWVFVCDDEVEQLKEIAPKILPEASFEIISRPGLRTLSSYGEALMSVFTHLVDRCIVDKSPMLVSTPDFLWADGALSNLAAVASLPGLCAAVPHIRVLPTILDELDANEKFRPYPPPNGARLMYSAWRHPHPAWTMSNLNGDTSGIYKGGVGWQRVSPTIALVTHVMPSPFWCNFTSSDMVFFRLFPNNAWGAFDHNWPAHLLQNDRLRLIGSSDAVCMAEVTDKDANVPPAIALDPANPAAFHLDGFNIRMQRQFVSVFRGEA